jgi:hypothetical protein
MKQERSGQEAMAVRFQDRCENGSDATDIAERESVGTCWVPAIVNRIPAPWSVPGSVNEVASRPQPSGRFFYGDVLGS